MKKNKFIYVWEYFVKDDCISKFKNIYNPQGDWAQLFKKSQGFIETEFYQDIQNKNRFITVDSWDSKEARDNFRENYSEGFRILDKFCEKLTKHENFIGDFYTSNHLKID
ncbi:antibiotic biosynthesis monooxygenase [uncultured Winogradskyella sp.]|uniref:putative quinol monooxygenase n=1 Tax=uncultured Winogradskyella sp. TaxID=395353 RepID=UPI0026021ACD|nr:antibiotic biosynthesis monooxygenase [uncultured Winogradskyella sp.]